MEEQKKNSKEIKMSVPKKNTQGNNEEAPKYTYEQLKEIVDKLFSENRYLRQQLYQASETIRMFNRLDYLFKVVENASVFNDMMFVNNCLEEIKDAMTITENKEEEEKEK